MDATFTYLANKRYLKGLEAFLSSVLRPGPPSIPGMIQVCY